MALLPSGQAQKGREGRGNAEQRYRDLTSVSASHVASQARFPRETCVRPLRARKDHVRVGERSGRE